MGKYKHHSGSVGGGVNLSKGKTPHDKDIKDMPLFKMGKPYSMGASKRGPLDKHGMSQDHKMAYDRSEISRLKKDIHYDDLKKKGMSMEGPLEGNAFGYAMQKTGGDYDKAKAMLQKKGPLNKEDKKKERKQKAFNRKATKVYENRDIFGLASKSTQRKANAAARKYQKHLAEPGETITNVAGVSVSPANKKKGKISEKRAFKKVEKGKATVHYKSGKSGEVMIKQPGRRNKVIKNYNSLQQ